MKRIGGMQVQVDQILYTGQINGYRNKVTLHSDGGTLGFYSVGSHDVVPIRHCLSLKDDLNKAIKDLVQMGSELDNELTLRSGRNRLNSPL